MNERIRELERQAIEYANQQNTFDPRSEFNKKFTELIVLECCDIFIELRTRPADLAVKDLKKHFGIK